MSDREVAVIFAEGTRSTTAKRRRALERIAARDTARADRLDALRHLLPPRPGGAGALLSGAPDADVVLAWHTGFDGLDTFSGMIRALAAPLPPVRFVVRRVPRGAPRPRHGSGGLRALARRPVAPHGQRSRRRTSERVVTNATALLAAAIAIAIVMLTTWVVSVIVRNASIVDIVWGLGFVVVAWAVRLQGDTNTARQWLLVALVTIWGLRLGGYLFLRNHGQPEDYRYQAMRRHWGPRFWLISLATVFTSAGGADVDGVAAGAAGAGARTPRASDRSR